MENNEEKTEVKTKTKKVNVKTPVTDETKTRSWKSVFIENYTGASEEAKALEPFLKNTYKGDVYIPWAVMERLVYMCDENAKFTNICNANGGLVHSDILVNHQSNTQKGEVISETEAPMYSHFVKVALEFMGKVFIEDYPIQEQDYTAAKIYNQNLVNRALQRAKAKVGARATGLGLKLYEGLDLQFDSAKETKKPELVKTAPKTAPVEVKVKQESIKTAPDEAKVEVTDKQVEHNTVIENVSEPQNVEVPEVTDSIDSLIKLLKTTPEDKINPVLQRVNLSIMKKYSFALSINDTDEELRDKISKFPNPEQFEKTIKNLLK